MNSDNKRLNYGIFAGVFGVISNSILFIGKIIIGLMCASVTIIADAINNLADIGSSVILLLGFKLSNRPADSEHPFGHARYEQIMALIISVAILMIGAILSTTSIEKLISNDKTIVNSVTYIVLSLAIVIKFIQMLIYANFAKKTNSMSLKASSVDSRNDCFTTLFALIAMIIIDLVKDIPFSVDGLFGLIISLFIIINSIKLVRETISPLLGEKPNEKLILSIREKILSYDKILGVHDMLLHSYGVNNYIGSAHVEINGNYNLIKAHNLIDKIERDIKNEFNIKFSIHLDPLQIGNKQVDRNKERIISLLQSLDEEITIHDFRIEFEKDCNKILFDVVVPYEKNINLDEIYLLLNDYYKKYKKKYLFIINLDKK